MGICIRELVGVEMVPCGVVYVIVDARKSIHSPGHVGSPYRAISVEFPHFY